MINLGAHRQSLTRLLNKIREFERTFGTCTDLRILNGITDETAAFAITFTEFDISALKILIANPGIAPQWFNRRANEYSAFIQSAVLIRESAANAITANMQGDVNEAIIEVFAYLIDQYGAEEAKRLLIQISPETEEQKKIITDGYRTAKAIIDGRN